MVENRRGFRLACHLLLLVGVAIVAFPVWLTFVGATLTAEEILAAPMPVLPGGRLLENMATVLSSGSGMGSSAPVSTMLFNSLVMALVIAIGKIAISLLSAFAIVYFRFPFRTTAFWLIFVTLMLPVEVRIVPAPAGRRGPRGPARGPRRWPRARPARARRGTPGRPRPAGAGAPA